MQKVTQARRIVFLALPPVEEIDLFGPVSCFIGASRVLGGRQHSYQVEIVAGVEGHAMEGHSRVSLLAANSFEECKGTIDTLIIASGRKAHLPQSKQLLSWIVKKAERCRRVVSICTGAFILAQAGLLDRSRATNHWQWTEQLAKDFLLVQVQSDSIWVGDDKFFTSAGVTSGIDLALALIEEGLGSDIALDIARNLVVFLRRPGGQAQFSVALNQHQPDLPSFRELQLWIAQHLDQNLSVDLLAHRVAMSPRNFARIFKHEIGETPARYVQLLRLEQARRMLEHGEYSLERIAMACGYSHVQLLRRALQRELGVAPGEYRQRFRTSA